MSEEHTDSLIPWLIPVMFASLLLTLNVGTVSVVISELLHQRLLANLLTQGFAAILLPLFVVYSIMYLVWIRTNRYREFPEEFKHESRKQRQLRGILILIYEATSILSLPMVGVFLHGRQL